VTPFSSCDNQRTLPPHVVSLDDLSKVPSNAKTVSCNPSIILKYNFKKKSKERSFRQSIDFDPSYPLWEPSQGKSAMQRFMSNSLVKTALLLRVEWFKTIHIGNIY
jgi:hypothetical protein